MRALLIKYQKNFYEVTLKNTRLFKCFKKKKRSKRTLRLRGLSLLKVLGLINQVLSSKSEAICNWFFVKRISLI